MRHIFRWALCFFASPDLFMRSCPEFEVSEGCQEIIGIPQDLRTAPTAAITFYFDSNCAQFYRKKIHLVEKKLSCVTLI